MVTMHIYIYNIVICVYIYIYLYCFVKKQPAKERICNHRG